VDFTIFVLDHERRIIQAQMTRMLNAAQSLANFSSFVGIVKGNHNQIRHFIPPVLMHTQ